MTATELRRRPLTREQIKGAALLAAGASNAQIARALGIRPETVSRWKSNPLFAAELRRLVLLAETGTTRERVEALTPKALDALQAALTDTRAGSLPLRVDAARALLSFAAHLAKSGPA